jgi:transportin-1
MSYTQADALNLLNAEASAAEENNIRPRHHRTTMHGAGSGVAGDARDPAQAQAINYGEDDDDDDLDDDDDDDDEEMYAEWTLRKCSAAALDMIAGVFKDRILEDLIRILHAKIATKVWLEEESAILALGAVAEGAFLEP